MTTKYPICFSATVLVVVVAALVGCDRRLDSDPAPNAVSSITFRQALEVDSEGPADGGASIPTANPTGVFTLRGKFTISGAPSDNPLQKISRDTATCAPGGRRVYDRQLVVTPPADGGGIASVLIFADGIPDSWVHESAKPGKTDEVIFDQKECVFLRRLTAMQTTQKLKIFNSDPVGHNTNLSPRFNSSFDQTIASRSFATYQPQVEEKEPFPVRCAIHSWMLSWMITRDNSYFAVSASDGTFEIPHLPAGVEIKFRVWHERCRFVPKVVVGGESQSWSKGRFTLRMDPDTTHEMDVVIDSSVLQ